MSPENMLWCVTLTALLLCCGGAEEAQAGGEKLLQGRLRLSREGLRAGSLTRAGSLSFTNVKHGDQNSTNEFHVAKLKRMAPSVQCGDNLMTLKVKRTGAQHFLVDSGDAPLPPLSQMSPSCGFSVKRFRRDVEYAASYKGCHVNKQDEDYALPLRLWGAPMTMSCPNMLPVPSVLCFPNKMVLKIRGVSAKELKVKVSGTWQPLSAACSRCGLTFNESAGELTLTAPYIKGLCIEIKDEEYVFSLQWADFDLSASCPPVAQTEPTKGSTPPPSDNGQALKPTPYPFSPIFSQFLEPQSTLSPGLLPPLPFSFVAAEFPEKQKVAEAQYPSFMSQFPQFYRLPERESAQSSKDRAAGKQMPFHQISHSPQYQLPPLPELHNFGRNFPATTLPPASTAATVTTTTTGQSKTPRVAFQPQFPVLLQYPLSPFIQQPFSPESSAQAVESQLNPQILKFPMFSPSFNPFSEEKTTPAPTTVVTTTEMPPPEKSLNQQHSFMPVYVVPKQSQFPLFLHPAAMSLDSEQANQHEYRPFFHAMQSLFPFHPDGGQTMLPNPKKEPAD